MRKVGNRLADGVALDVAGSIYAEQGAYSEALHSFEESRKVAEALGNRPLLASTLNSAAPRLIAWPTLGNQVSVPLRRL